MIDEEALEEKQDHEMAIDYIASKLLHEFKNKPHRPSRSLNGCIPDLVIKNKRGNLVVIEVGDTKAIKIFKYLKCENVDQIRWYTKNGKMIGKWNHKFKENNVRHTQAELLTRVKAEMEYYKNEQKMLSEELEEQYSKNKNLKNNFERIYFWCSNCESYQRLIYANIQRYAAGYKLICEDCHSRTLGTNDKLYNVPWVKPKPINKSKLPKEDNRLRKGWINELTKEE